MLAGSTAFGGTSGGRPEVQRIIAHTRETRATYSLFNWNVITPRGGTAREEWSAEFNSDNLHRVETPKFRIIADCAHRTGTVLNVETGETSDGPGVAATACGIDATMTITSAALLRSTAGVWGPISNLRIQTKDDVRTYAIERRGIIVGETIADKAGHTFLKMTAREIRDWVPHDIFTVSSLQRSVVSDAFKTAPQSN